MERIGRVRDECITVGDREELYEDVREGHLRCDALDPGIEQKGSHVLTAAIEHSILAAGTDIWPR